MVWPENTWKTMSEKSLENRISGFYTSDCSVRNRNMFYFILYEDYTRWPESKWDPNSSGFPFETDIEKRILIWVRDQSEAKQWSHQSLTGVYRMFGDSCVKPKPQFVGVGGPIVYSIGSGEKGFENDIPYFEDGGPFRGAIIKSRCIDGWLYVCGGNNSLGKRLANSDWYSFTKKIPNPKRSDRLSNSFYDVDGFSENEIYVAADTGKVYCFNGTDWQMKTLPTDGNFQSLCCAGDGFVYVSGMHGATYKGRGDQWKCLYKGHLETDPMPGMLLGFHDMVWYEDRVWCTSDYGLWTIKDDRLEEADVPGFVHGCMGNLSVADGVLLLAGHGGAAFLENGQWHAIY